MNPSAFQDAKLAYKRMPLAPNPRSRRPPPSAAGTESDLINQDVLSVPNDGATMTQRIAAIPTVC